MSYEPSGVSYEPSAVSYKASGRAKGAMKEGYEVSAGSYEASGVSYEASGVSYEASGVSYEASGDLSETSPHMDSERSHRPPPHRWMSVCLSSGSGVQVSRITRAPDPVVADAGRRDAVEAIGRAQVRRIAEPASPAQHPEFVAVVQVCHGVVGCETIVTS